MQKKLKKEKNKISNKTTILIAVILMISGIFVIGYDYLMIKKDKVYEKMSYELSNIPDLIETEEIVPDSELSDNDNLIEEIEQTGSTTTVQTDKTTGTTVTYNYIGYLEIPKIDLKKGFVPINSGYNNVNKNIAIMRGSNYPNVENSLLVFAAHNGTCWNCYFRNLNKLSIKDIAIVYYNNVKYTYELVDTYTIKKTGELTIYRNPNKNTLVLTTCAWGNIKTKQSVFIFELINKENI